MSLRMGVLLEQNRSMTAIYDNAEAQRAESGRPAVYMAGPVDYIEHRTPGDHLRDNWRHRFFGDLPITMLCPTCLNAGGRADGLPGYREIMRRNAQAIRSAAFFVGYFPGDVATFGTPIEVHDWCMTDLYDRHSVLIHPASKGVFVQYLEAEYGLTVVRTFEEARQWLRHQLTAL